MREVAFEEGSSLRRIEEYAFSYCSSLKSICLPEGLETLGVRCCYMSALEEISLPSSVTGLEDETCFRCEGLKKIIFQEGSRLQKIGDSCFSSTSLEEFVAPPELK